MDIYFLKKAEQTTVQFHTDERPYIRAWGRFLLYLNQNIFVRRLVCKYYKLPFSTRMQAGFYCSCKKLVLGKNVSLGDSYIRAAGGVYIGDNTSLSYRNSIISTTHDFNDWSTIIAKPVIIGKNVWITTNVTILPGVTIGDNTVIGAGSVVTSNIPSGVLAAGNPCKVIKRICFRNEDKYIKKVVNE